MQKTKGGQSLLQGAGILAGAMITVKLIGAIFKIPLGNILDGDGMGYFSTAYSVFSMIFAFSTAGLPAAIAKMVAEQSVHDRYRDIRKIHKISTRLFFFMGLIGFILMVAFSWAYVRIADNLNAWLSVIAIAPAIFFGCVMSAYRGYYEGLRNMTPTAVSQIVEVVAKLVFGLLLSIIPLQIGMSQFSAGKAVFGRIVATEIEARAAIMPIASAGAIFGVTISTFVGTAFLLIKNKTKGDNITKEDLDNSPQPMTGKKLVIELIKIAVPISLGSIVMNVAQLIDTLTIINRLGAGFVSNYDGMMLMIGGHLKAGVSPSEAANFIFGSYSGYALSIFNLVPAFTSIFGKSALPNVAAGWEGKNIPAVKINIESVIRMTSLICIPASFGIFFLANPILSLLYPLKYSEVAIASGVLSWQGLSLVFLGLTVPLFAVLQALDRPDLPPKFMLVGAVLKFLVNWYTIPIPFLNVKGAALGTASCYISILILCLIYLKKITNINFKFVSLIYKPLISGFICGLSGKLIYNLLARFIDGNFKTLISIGFAGVIYLVLLLFTRSLSKDDILMLPKGEKFVKILAKYKLIG